MNDIKIVKQIEKKIRELEEFKKPMLLPELEKFYAEYYKYDSILVEPVYLELEEVGKCYTDNKEISHLFNLIRREVEYIVDTDVKDRDITSLGTMIANLRPLINKYIIDNKYLFAGVADNKTVASRNILTIINDYIINANISEVSWKTNQEEAIYHIKKQAEIYSRACDNKQALEIILLVCKLKEIDYPPKV